MSCLRLTGNLALQPLTARRPRPLGDAQATYAKPQRGRDYVQNRPQPKLVDA
ncbi:hypothetical protein [Hymenobacter sp. GOD-10R]|uniref:hypothetical protein n=1 Tax=Hymenobacter sp. GOD-10R TaxID=3093922 RepID=UPI002D79DC0B|nr:hypothetical protein [Hymenobacter sp. GOD-10R]WRQ30339.1 hypothetical protein SD425_08710 [Hymenobacter sp. GOD-10R]